MTQRLILLYFASFTFFACAQDPAKTDAPAANKEGLQTPSTELISPSESKKDSLTAAKIREMEKTWEAPYDIDVDASIFDKHQMNEFSSTKYPNAKLLVMISAGSFEQIKANFSTMKGPRSTDVVVERKELAFGDRKALFMKLNVERNTNKMMMHNYVLPGDKDASIFLTGVCEPKDEAALKAAFDKAAASLRLNGNPYSRKQKAGN